MYIHRTMESLALKFEIGTTNCHSTVITNVGGSALSFSSLRVLYSVKGWSSKLLTQINFGQPYLCFVQKLADGRLLILALHTHLLVVTLMELSIHVCCLPILSSAVLLCSIFMGWTPILVTVDPEMIKQIYVKNFDKFPQRMVCMYYMPCTYCYFITCFCT